MAELERVRAALAGRFTIERPLGEGGMAVVYLARDLRHDRAVAVKVLRPDLAATLGPERFLREIQVTARLQHPHILPLLDSGDAEGLLYYAMPFVAGESLRQRLDRERQLPLEEALRLVREVADALDYAHRQDVVHRDLKPENILLSDGHALVADFGIARAVSAAVPGGLTTAGTVIGTPAYMSPEQAAGDPVDGRADLYSLGCVLYEALAGAPPFTGPTAESLVHQHLSVAPRPVTELRPSVPAAVMRAIHRALAKTPADRFTTAARLAEALGDPTATVAAGPPAPAAGPTSVGAARRSWRVPVMVASVAAALVGGAYALWWNGWLSLPVGTDHAPRKEGWILVADFDGPADDSSLAVATRDLVSAGLDQSAIVSTVPADQIRLALESAGRPPRSRLDPELARQLAYRRSVRAVLEGRISRLGGGFAIVLRVVDADSARVLLTVDEAAESERHLIATVGRVAHRLRSGLGERRAQLRATRPLDDVTTPSFEAFRYLVRARQVVWGGGDQRGAIALARGAIALDPDFAEAWGLMAACFGNLGQPDSATGALREALRSPQRLTETRRLLLTAQAAYLDRDDEAALRALEQLARVDPGNATAYHNQGSILAWLGRYDEALASYRRATEVSPFGPSTLLSSNEFWCLIALRRLDEAGEMARRLGTGDRGLEASLVLPLAAARWAQAESLGAALAREVRAPRWIRRYAGFVTAATQAARGQARSSAATLARIREQCEADREPVWAEVARLYGLLLALISGRRPGEVPSDLEPGDGSPIAMVVRGMWLSAYGDTVEARRLLSTVRRLPPREIRWQASGPIIVEALLAARAEDWKAVLNLLLPAARRGDDPGYVQKSYRVFTRWLVADAYERLGRPDSAAAYFHLAVSPGTRGSLVDTGMAHSFGLLRLVLLEARLGRTAEARRDWDLLSQTCIRPDPDVRLRLDEARAALAAAEALAMPARP